ncbi:hypothetical protein [Corynebacterium xerosis]|uniref:Uncharacterized protein n=1 Tax=Corynebacterium xerosis TaxID=1725 RepID=A0ABV3URE3_9CORY
MNSGVPGSGSDKKTSFFQELFQGDVLTLTQPLNLRTRLRLFCSPFRRWRESSLFPGWTNEKATHNFPNGFLIVSQTCDVINVSASKDRITLAPIFPVRDDDEKMDAKRGAIPLKVPAGRSVSQLADMSKVFSVRKSEIEDLVRFEAHSCDVDDIRSTREFSSVIAAVYGRFAFPDAVHLAFRDLQDSIQKGRAGKNKSKVSGATNFSKVLRHVDDVRIAAEDWAAGSLDLSVSVIVDDSWLVDVERLDRAVTSLSSSSLNPGGGSRDHTLLAMAWDLLPDSDRGIQKRLTEAGLEKISELILRVHSEDIPECDHRCRGGAHVENCAALIVEMQKNVLLAELWSRFGEKMEEKIKINKSKGKIGSVALEVTNRNDFTYASWMASESLQFGRLSNAQNLREPS